MRFALILFQNKAIVYKNFEKWNKELRSLWILSHNVLQKVWDFPPSLSILLQKEENHFPH